MLFTDAKGGKKGGGKKKGGSFQTVSALFRVIFILSTFYGLFLNTFFKNFMQEPSILFGTSMTHYYCIFLLTAHCCTLRYLLGRPQHGWSGFNLLIHKPDYSNNYFR